MAKEDSAKHTSSKGKAFFERGDQVAETGNWDFAMEMYLEGIARDPDNVDQGHQPLREDLAPRRPKRQSSTPSSCWPRNPARSSTWFNSTTPPRNRN